MKYVKQLMLIMVISMLGEALHSLLPLPVPASIYGLLILFFSFVCGIVKVEQLEEVSTFFLAIMPLLFISPSVSLMTAADKLLNGFVPIIGTIVLSTIVTTVVTGLVTQGVMRRVQRKKQEKTARKHNENTGKEL